MRCVADGGASGAGTEEGTSFHVTSLVAQPVGLHKADFDFRGSATGTRTLEPTGIQPDGPANTFRAAGRSEWADFEFKRLR